MAYLLRDQPDLIEDVILHLGHDVKSTRSRRLDTQTALSERAGISQSTWSMLENGLAEGIRLETLAKMAIVLECDIVLRRCDHPEWAGQDPSNGRIRRVEGATVIPGRRGLVPGPGWEPRGRW